MPSRQHPREVAVRSLIRADFMEGSPCASAHPVRPTVTTLSVWAPAASVVKVETRDARHRLRSDVRSGWWIADLPIEHGDDYAFVLDDGDPLPDPRSRWQPHGVHAASRWYDHELFEWSDAGWRGVRLAGSVVYEMHVGTFTAERNLRCRDRASRPSRSSRRRPRRSDAGRRIRRHAGLGVRRRQPVRRARAVRRPGRIQALRRRLPRPRARRRARRRLQPPGP